MKKISSFSLVFLLSLAFLASSCKKEKNNQIDQVEFALDLNLLKSTNANDSTSVSGISSLIITITDVSGKVVMNSQKIDLFTINGSYVSKPISLQKGRYTITDFLVLDWKNNIVYAAPVMGSSKSYLIQNPLPLSFSTQTNIISKVAPEVLSVANSNSEDFGYASFNFTVAQTFDFLIGAFTYEDAIKNYKLTTANISILTDSTSVLYNGFLSPNSNIPVYDSVAITNKITLPERFNHYTLVVSKQGYKTFKQTYNKEELKLHFRSVDKGPLVIILNKNLSAIEIRSITTNSALCVSETPYMAGSSVTARGLCWSTEQNPTIVNSKTNDGNGNDKFSSTITALSAFTTYYVRAYATYGINTVYSSEKCFATAGWVQKASMPDEGRYAAISFNINGKAYVGTGTKSDGTYLSDLWEYDPARDIWTKKADFPGGGRSGATAFAIKNKGYIGLGSGDNISANFKSDLWEYDPLNNVWTQKANFPGNLRANGKSFVIGDTAFVGTGTYNNGKDYLYDFYMYVPAINTWAQRSDFGGSHRNGAVAFSIENIGYMGAGAESNTIRRNDVWSYNKITNTWLRIADFPGGTRVSSCSFTIGTKSYIGTGEDGTNHYSSFYEYNPSNDAWSPEIINTAPPRTNAVGFSIGNMGYFATGNYSTICFADLWAFTPGVVNY